MTETGALAETERRARTYCAEARDALAAFPPSPAREALDGIAEFVVARLS